MKKKDFENRLQNDLFPEMPPSFERKLRQAMESEGVKVKKRPSAAGVFAASVSVLAAAACLVILFLGLLGGSRSRIEPAAPGETAAATEAPYTWDWSTKVFTLSTGFEFANEEKFEALYTGILRFLREQGEREPEELWLCAIKSRFVSADTGDRSDGYLSGYYVLAQHTFGEKNGAPELYCLSEDMEVLWATEGSVPGPNHVVNPEDTEAAAYQGHLLYGTEPFIPEPGIPHVQRGVLVGSEPGTDIVFSMASSITEVQNRLAAAGSAHLGAAREYFLVTVSAHDWSSVMENPILRFETLEGPVDVNMKTDLPKAMVVIPTTRTISNVELVKEVQREVLKADQTRVVDLTGRTCLTGEPDYGTLILRALEVSGVQSPRELWLCAVDPFSENEATVHRRALILAQYAFEGAAGPELFFYEDGRIVWMTEGYEPEGINVAVDEARGLTVLFGVSPAYDGRPLAMTSGVVTIAGDNRRTFGPVLPLNRVQQIVGEGPNYDCAREFFLCSLPHGGEVTGLTIEAAGKAFTRTGKTVVWPAKPVPAMAVVTDAGVFPGECTHFDNSLYVSAKGENYYSGGKEVIVTLEKLRQHPEQAPEIQAGSEESRRVITRSDTVEVQAVRVFTDGLEDVALSWENKQAMELPQGNYYVCYLYRDTTPDETYVPGSGQRKYVEEWAVYRVRVTESVTPAIASPCGLYKADMLPEYSSDPDQVDKTGFRKVMMAYGGFPISFVPANERQTLQRVLVYDASGTMFLQESEGISLLSKLPCGSYCVVLLTSSAEDGAANAFGIGLSIVPPLIVETERDLVRGTLTEDYQSLDQNGVSARGEPTLSLVEKAYRMYEADPKSVPSFTLEPGGWSTQPEEGIVLTGVDVYDVADQAQRVSGAADGPLELYGASMRIGELNDLPSGEYCLCFHAKWQGREDPETGITPFETRLVIFRIRVK